MEFSDLGLHDYSGLGLMGYIVEVFKIFSFLRSMDFSDFMVLD